MKCFMGASGVQTIFDILEFILDSVAWGNRTKEILFIAEPQDDFFCFIPSSLTILIYRNWSIERFSLVSELHA